MTKKAAFDLADYISLERRDAFAYELGNGDWCVRLKNPVYFLWTMADWLAFRQSKEDQLSRKTLALQAV